jgi:hypothetical protein
MQSGFGKRKARKIQVDEDDDGPTSETQSSAALNTGKSLQTTALSTADFEKTADSSN